VALKFCVCRRARDAEKSRNGGGDGKNEGKIEFITSFSIEVRGDPVAFCNECFE